MLWNSDKSVTVIPTGADSPALGAQQKEKPTSRCKEKREAVDSLTRGKPEQEGCAVCAASQVGSQYWDKYGAIGG